MATPTATQPPVSEKVDVEHVSEKASDTTIPEWTIEEEKRIRNKIDWYIVPTVTVLYLLCFIDRANIGNARIQGMEKDLKLTGMKFNWVLTIFYIPYLLVEVPANIILKRIGAKIWIPFLVFGFGFVSMCMAFVTSFNGLLAARFFLGVFEGGTMPGIAFFLSNFYRRHELMFRLGILISGSSMAGAFGGLFATALSKIPEWGASSMRLEQWRNIFFFEGIITILFAIAGYFLLPTSPLTSSFLTPREQQIAHERIQREHKEAGAEKTTSKHVTRAVLNINNFMMAMGFFFCNITVQSYSLFLPTILRALWTDTTKVQLLTVPPYVAAAGWSIFVSWLSDRVRRRGLFIVTHGIVAMIGYCVLISTMSVKVRYFAVYLSAMGAFPLGPFFLGWGINNAAGPTIRAVTSAYIVSVGTCGAIVATWTYIGWRDAPRFITCHSINIGAQVMVTLIGVSGIIYARWENRQRNAGRRDHRTEGLGTEEALRQLGYRHPEFRYVE